MEVSAENESPLPTNVLNNSSYLFDRIRHISINCVNCLLSYSGSIRIKTCIPLPPAAAAASLPDHVAPHIILLEDIIEHTLQNLQNIHENLMFWQSKAKLSDIQKAYFLVCERGPCAFVKGSVQLIRDCRADRAGVQNLYGSASSHISERIHVLTNLRCFLATLMAEVYMEVGKIREDLVIDSLLAAVNDAFINFENSIILFQANRQRRHSVDDGSFYLPDKFTELKDNTNSATDLAINLIYENLRKLDSYSSGLVSRHCKPKKVTLYWMRYSCWALGIAICCIWILHRRKLMGCSDIDYWIRKAEDSTICFWKDHVEQTILSIRDDLLETSQKRQKAAMELEEVQLTAGSLHRMLLASVSR